MSAVARQVALVDTLVVGFAGHRGTQTGTAVERIAAPRPTTPWGRAGCPATAANTRWRNRITVHPRV
jgi:hypothetical protein